LYYNSDGIPASMCGNGGRCIAALAYDNGLADKKLTFLASDGVHEALINKEIVKGKHFDVSLKMIDVEGVDRRLDGYFLNTGVPHFVKFVERLESLDVFNEGRKIRNDPAFFPEGANVNFVQLKPDQLHVRTYERGVEDETLSCGTGVTAAAIVAFLASGVQELPIHTKGGNFAVKFEKKGKQFVNIWLSGSAEKVFEGEIAI